MKFEINQKVYVHRVKSYGYISEYSGLRYMVTLDNGSSFRYEEEDITHGD